MKERRVTAIATFSLIFGNLAIAAVGALCGWKRKPNGETAAEKENAEDRSSPGEELESLSLSTPGDAPLDKLAREAAFEKALEGSSQLDEEIGSIVKPEPKGPEQTWTHDSPVVAELLQHQALESARLKGWHLPLPERLPVPTFTPAVMALGIVIFAMGLATIWYVCAVGAIVFAIAAWRWTGELQGG